MDQIIENNVVDDIDDRYLIVQEDLFESDWFASSEESSVG